MTLNSVMDVTLHYFSEYGKPAFQHITAVTFMVLGGTVPPPHISGPALCCVFLHS